MLSDFQISFPSQNFQVHPQLRPNPSFKHTQMTRQIY